MPLESLAQAAPQTPTLHPALGALIGQWRLTDSLMGERIPPIEIKTQQTTDGRGIIVNVYEKNAQDQWEVILVEHMVYDAISDAIYVQWSSPEQVGKGEGKHDPKRNTLRFKDSDMRGKPTLEVEFELVSTQKYHLHGFDPSGKKLWAFVYERVE